MDNNWVKLVLSEIIWQLPFLAVYLVGTCLAIIQFRKHPKVSMMALAAYALATSSLLVGVGWRLWIQTGNFESARTYMVMVQAIIVLLAAPAQVFLLIAVFGWRSGSQEDDHQRSNGGINGNPEH